MKIDTPALPKLVIHHLPVTTPMAMRNSGESKIQHDVEARTPRGRLLKRWSWWEANRPRRRNARYLVLDGQRYEISHCFAKEDRT